MRNTIDILGVKIDKISAEYALRKAEQMVRTPGVAAIFTPNPEIVMAAYEDPEFKDILNSADMCTPDGIGVVYAAKMVGTPVPERVAGFDYIKEQADFITEKDNNHDGISDFLEKYVL